LQKEKGKTSIHSVHVLNTQFEPQLFSDNERVKEDSFDWLDQAMTVGEMLGAKYYTFHGIARYKKATRSGDNDDFSKLAKGLCEIDEFCQSRHGIALSLENVEWALAHRPIFFEKIHAYLPHLHTVFDCKQARISGYDTAEYLRVMKNVSHAHLSDVDERGQVCLPGKGKTDFKQLLFRLKETGFDGPILIEVYKDNYGDLIELKNACEFLEELIYKYSL
jgi:sugar phosphate isomerase/epimerase